jgi:hypothetical protein
MPKGDKTGPQAEAPMSGRGAGFCAGYDMPGYMNPMSRMGMRHSWRRRRWHNMTFGFSRYCGMRYAAFEVPYPPEEKEEMLKKRETWLQEQLEEVRSELNGTAKKPE